jgi:hypothetical protein
METRIVTLEFRRVVDERPPEHTLVYVMQYGESPIHAVEYKHRPDHEWEWEDARGDFFERVLPDDMWAPIP